MVILRWITHINGKKCIAAARAAGTTLLISLLMLGKMRYGQKLN